MKNAPIRLLALISILGLYFSLMLYAVPGNGNLKISPTGSHCINDVQSIKGTWSAKQGEWEAIEATLQYQNTRDLVDRGDVSNDGSSGKLSLALGADVGQYDLSLVVTYKCGEEEITIKETAEICIVDVAYVSGGGGFSCLNSVKSFHAEAAPNACDFPKNSLRWEVSRKLFGDHTDWDSIPNSNGKEDILFSPKQDGFFKVRAKCGKNGDWVESEEFIVIDILIKAGYKVGSNFSPVIIAKTAAPYTIDLFSALIPNELYEPEYSEGIKKFHWMYAAGDAVAFTEGPEITAEKLSVPTAGSYRIKSSCGDVVINVFIVDKITIKEHVKGVLKGDEKELLTKVLIEGGVEKLPDEMKSFVQLKIKSLGVGLDNIEQEIKDGVAKVKYKTKDIIASELNKALTNAKLNLVLDVSQELLDKQNYTSAIIDKLTDFRRTNFKPADLYELTDLVKMAPLGAIENPEIRSSAKELLLAGLSVIDSTNGNLDFGKLKYIGNSFAPTLEIGADGTPKTGDAIVRVLQDSSLWKYYDGLRPWQQHFTVLTMKLVGDLSGITFKNPGAIDYDFDHIKIIATPFDGKFTLISDSFSSDFITDFSDPANMILKLKANRSTILKKGLANAKFDFQVESADGEVTANFEGQANIGKTFKFESVNAINGGGSMFSEIATSMKLRIESEFKSEIQNMTGFSIDQRSIVNGDLLSRVEGERFGATFKANVLSVFDANIDAVNGTLDLDASLELFYTIFDNPHVRFKVYNKNSLVVSYENFFYGNGPEEYDFNAVLGLESLLFKKKKWEMIFRNEVGYLYSNTFGDELAFRSFFDISYGGKIK